MESTPTLQLLLRKELSTKTTKEKLMSFLLAEAKRSGNCEFRISFDRQALADFLGVERSAMSVELSKLRKTGILDYKGSYFRLTSTSTPNKTV